MTEKADLLTEAHNYAVVQLPGRRYPGVVVQGDTLFNLVRALTPSGDGKRDPDKVQDVFETLSEVLADYKKVCAQNGTGLPFVDDDRQHSE
ncbi:DUF6959 family protein [uncultured Roseibium sp.]|uniref:DUF6959 family protein n=1 Tax=uncultured Roseibium sp. TaxID=1936171 RepID=UPI003216AB05